MAAVQAASPPTGSVIIGQVTCFRIRVPDRGESIQDRVNRIQDISAKFLGGDTVRITIRPLGSRRHIDVNDEFLIAVTPEDARATGHRTAATLAPVWRLALERAFRQSSARPVAPPPAPPSE
jgi:hypothetical protein